MTELQNYAAEDERARARAMCSALSVVVVLNVFAPGKHSCSYMWAYLSFVFDTRSLINWQVAGCTTCKIYD